MAKRTITIDVLMQDYGFKLVLTDSVQTAYSTPPEFELQSEALRAAAAFVIDKAEALEAMGK